MKKIIKQYKKAQDLCNKANLACQALAHTIVPYIHEDLREDINVVDQHGDGLVLEWDNNNYPIDEVIKAIRNGFKDIDMRECSCPLCSI